MKRFQIIIALLFLQAATLGAQECYRFSYIQKQKASASAKQYKVNDMKLDYDGKSVFFYNEVSYKRDSLNVVAFDNRGNIVNEDAYSERTRLPGTATNDKTVIDFSKAEMTQLYFDIAYFDGSMPLELPQWELSEEEGEKAGYICKMAKGSYLGRDWTIWFTEEIPVNVGPWLLWGAPGLIVYAEDSEAIFNFTISGVEKIPESRLSRDRSYLKTLQSKPSAKVYSLPMKDMETMHTKYMRDVAYFNKIHGITEGYSEDRNGNRIEMQMTRPYLPYIADEYWRSK